MDVDVGFALLLATLAGLSTGIGSTISWFIYRPRPSHSALVFGFSAGVMLYVSFGELLTTAVSEVGLVRANLGFFIGIVVLAILDMTIPHEYKEERIEDTHPSAARGKVFRRRNGTVLASSRKTARSSILMRTGVLIAIGIAIHNFPEGLAVFAAAATGDINLGVTIAVAIAIHNIPEGISVSAPILDATGSRRKAFLYSFSAGLAEPVGAIIGYAILRPFLTPTFLSALLAFAAGVMVYISLDELLPAAHQYGKSHLVIVGVGAGMLVMAVSIILLA